MHESFVLTLHFPETTGNHKDLTLAQGFNQAQQSFSWHILRSGEIKAKVNMMGEY